MEFEKPVKKEYTPEEIEEMEKIRDRVDKLRETDDPHEEADSVEELAYFENAKRAEIEDNLKKVLHNEKNYTQEELDEELEKKSAHIDFTGNLVSTSELGKMEEKKKSWTDEKTGLRNNRYIEDNISHILAREVRENERINYKGFSVIFIDINKFKDINDAIGHIKADEVLKTVAQIINDGVRESDFTCRWAGDEFVILLPDCNFQGAEIVVERIRDKLEKTKFDSLGNEKVTLSIGFVNSKDVLNLDWKEMLQRADRAMYYAKQELGSNQMADFDHIPKSFDLNKRDKNK